jgi:hypothetical protein
VSELAKARWKAAEPLMDHQVVGSDHQVSRVGNKVAGTKVVAEWAVVPIKGWPGSELKGAVAALAAESVHKDEGRGLGDKATVGRPRTTQKGVEGWP